MVFNNLFYLFIAHLECTTWIVVPVKARKGYLVAYHRGIGDRELLDKCLVKTRHCIFFFFKKGASPWVVESCTESNLVLSCSCVETIWHRKFLGPGTQSWQTSCGESQSKSKSLPVWEPMPVILAFVGWKWDYVFMVIQTIQHFPGQHGLHEGLFQLPTSPFWNTIYRIKVIVCKTSWSDFIGGAIHRQIRDSTMVSEVTQRLERIFLHSTK